MINEYKYAKSCNVGDIIVTTTFSYLTVARVIGKTANNIKVNLCKADRYWNISIEYLNNPSFENKIKYIDNDRIVYVIRNDEGVL